LFVVRKVERAEPREKAAAPVLSRAGTLSSNDALAASPGALSSGFRNTRKNRAYDNQAVRRPLDLASVTRSNRILADFACAAALSETIRADQSCRTVLDVGKALPTFRSRVRERGLRERDVALREADWGR